LTHNIFSGLKGFSFFDFYSSGDGWDDGYSIGDKDFNDNYAHPGDGFGSGDCGCDDDGDCCGPCYTYGDGDVGDAEGDGDSNFDEFCFSMDPNA
jgi:hypothetical protein